MREHEREEECTWEKEREDGKPNRQTKKGDKMQKREDVDGV